MRAKAEKPKAEVSETEERGVHSFRVHGFGSVLPVAEEFMLKEHELVLVASMAVDPVAGEPRGEVAAPTAAGPESPDPRPW